MQNDKVLLTIEYIVLSMSGEVLGNNLRVLPLVKYLRLYSSFNLTARALRFTTSMLWRALRGTRRFLLRKARSPLIWADVLYLYWLLTADMQVKSNTSVVAGLTTVYWCPLSWCVTYQQRTGMKIIMYTSTIIKDNVLSAAYVRASTSKY
jgi:hypothetical protein